MAPKWRAFTHYPGSISKLLRTLKLDDGLAKFIVTENGVRIQTTATSHSYNGHLFLPVEIFDTFTFEGEGTDEMIASLSLASIVHCLKMLIDWQPNDDSGSSSGNNNGLSKSATGCLFAYTPGSPLQISFAQGSMQTVCDLTTYEEEHQNYSQSLVQLDLQDIRLQAIMPADALTPVLADLDIAGALQLAVLAMQDPPRLIMQGTSPYTTMEFILPVENEAIETMIAEPGTKFNYDFLNVGKCRDIVKVASRVSIRCDGNGTLSVQCQCNFDNTRCYVEFRYLALID